MKQNRLMLTAGILAIASSLSILIGFFLLAKIFGYPDIIREGTAHLLSALHTKKDSVPYLYYLVGAGGLLMLFTSICLKKIVEIEQKSIFTELGMISGIIAGLLLYLGLQRYFVLFPYLGELQVAGNVDPEIIEVVFQSFSKYIGFSLTEHSMFIFLALMVLFYSISFLKTKIIPKWLCWTGVILSVSLLYGSAEVLNIPFGFIANRLASKGAGIWLLFVGLSLLLKALKQSNTNRQPSPTKIAQN